MRKKRQRKPPKKIKSKYNEINSNKIEPSYLNECLDYNPDTGSLIWKHRPERHFKIKRIYKAWNKRHEGKEAGGINKENGYIYLAINSIKCKAHRLAFCIYHGYMPENEIDHIDRVRHHNWIINLREVTRQCNSRNQGVRSDNKSGIKGVSFCKATEKWGAFIMVNQKSINLGSSKKFDEAAIKRWEAEVKYKFPNCNTSSSAYIYLKKRGLI